MTVETSVNYIGDLNPALPGPADPKSEGDDHVRNQKKAVVQSFAGFAGAILVTGTDGGAANAYTLTPATALPAYGNRMEVVFSPVASNTGASTMNISGLGAKSILRVDGAALVNGDLVAGRYYRLIYDGTALRLAAITKNYVDQLVISGTVPGSNNPANAGKFFTTDGTAGFWQAIVLDGRGSPLIDLGNSGTGTVTATYSSSAEGWTLVCNGAFNLAVSGFPSGRLSGGLMRITNPGAFAWTSTGVTWRKSDGTSTTTLASAGYAMQAAGTNDFAIWTYGDGTVYGRMV